MNYLDKAESALNYLAESEAEYAELKAQHQALKERLKIILANEMIHSDQKSQGMKEKEAESSENYIQSVTDWEEVLARFYLVEAKRKRAELTIEMYRSVNSALKRGNI